MQSLLLAVRQFVFLFFRHRGCMTSIFVVAVVLELIQLKQRLPLFFAHFKNRESVPIQPSGHFFGIVARIVIEIFPRGFGGDFLFVVVICYLVHNSFTVSFYREFSLRLRRLFQLAECNIILAIANA